MRVTLEGEARAGARRWVPAVTAGALLIVLGGCATDERGTAVPEEPPPAVSAPAPSNPGASTPGTPTPSPAGSPVSSAGRPSSANPPPGLPRPSSPPKTPTDVTSPGWVGGTVTAGGTGPCYGLVTDDGQEYALYSDQGWTLVKGTRIRALVEPNPLRINCGPGRHVRLVKFSKVG